MKILYGVQATGNGHISRSRVMAKYLKQENVDVTYLFSGREKSKLFDMEIFGDYLHRRGLTFSTNLGKIDYFQSLLTNNIYSFLRDIFSLNVDDYDLIITDFEPITAWAAIRANKPSLAIGHQYAFGINTPIAGESFLAKQIMNHFAPAKQSVGLHWSPFNDNVLPPIIDIELEKSATKGPILVYLPFEDQQQVTAMLNKFCDSRFVQYSEEFEDGEQQNVLLRQTCHQGFKSDLKQASGVICNSGFELNSECIYLGIPILTKPISGQMEQESNALAIEKLGLGQVMASLDIDKIDHWLNNLPPQKQQKIPDVAKAIVNWLTSNPKGEFSTIFQQLWHRQ